MIRFSTKFYVNEKLTHDIFIDMVLKWATEGQHYSFGELNWDGKEEYYVESSDALQSLCLNEKLSVNSKSLTSKKVSNKLKISMEKRYVCGIIYLQTAIS